MARVQLSSVLARKSATLPARLGVRAAVRDVAANQFSGLSISNLEVHFHDQVRDLLTHSHDSAACIQFASHPQVAPAASGGIARTSQLSFDRGEIGEES